MRIPLSNLIIVCLLVSGCSSQSSTSEAEIDSVAPTPIADLTPLATTDERDEQDERAAVRPSLESLETDFTLDPAPVPPIESSIDSPEAYSTESSSAADAIQSVTRVLRGAIEGEPNETEGKSSGSVFRSIGRALSKGFQEAAVEEESSSSD